MGSLTGVRAGATPSRRGGLVRPVVMWGLVCLLSGGLAGDAAAKSSTEKKNEAQKYFHLGRIHYRQGKVMEAIEAFRKAVDLDPRLGEAYNYLGLIYLERSQLGDAAKALRKATEINPYNTDAQNHLGVVYREQKKFDKAHERFAKALENRAYASPEKIHLNVGYTWLAQGNTPEAIRSFERAVALNPKYQLGLLGLGKAYQKAGRTELAAKTLRKVVDLGPDSPEAAEARQMLAEAPQPGGA